MAYCKSTNAYIIRVQPDHGTGIQTGRSGMIGKTERDPVVQGNNEPSGRLNLKGQQKPQYLIDAIEAEEKAFKDSCVAIDVYTDNQTDDNKKESERLFNVWREKQIRLQLSRIRWSNQECANG
jgi:hypothetical protein